MCQGFLSQCDGLWNFSKWNFSRSCQNVIASKTRVIRTICRLSFGTHLVGNSFKNLISCIFYSRICYSWPQWRKPYFLPPGSIIQHRNLSRPTCNPNENIPSKKQLTACLCEATPRVQGRIEIGIKTEETLQFFRLNPYTLERSILSLINQIKYKLKTQQYALPCIDYLKKTNLLAFGRQVSDIQYIPGKVMEEQAKFVGRIPTRCSDLLDPMS